MNDKKRQALMEKGAQNLHEGIRLANEDFINEIKRLSKDGSSEHLSPDAFEELMRKIHLIIDKYQHEKDAQTLLQCNESH